MSKRTHQYQRSLVDQLKILVDLANKEGLYDAADFILKILERYSDHVK